MLGKASARDFGELVSTAAEKGSQYGFPPDVVGLPLGPVSMAKGQEWGGGVVAQQHLKVQHWTTLGLAGPSRKTGLYVHTMDIYSPVHFLITFK